MIMHADMEHTSWTMVKCSISINHYKRYQPHHPADSCCPGSFMDAWANFSSIKTENKMKLVELKLAPT